MTRSPTFPSSERSPLSDTTKHEALLLAVRDLLYYARANKLPLADKVLIDVLATLNDWPAEELQWSS